ncbi:MAG: carbon-nitrogen hydrolase family protein [Thermosphaera sp.]
MNTDFQVIEAEDASFSKMAIAHIPVMVENFTRNIDLARRLVFYASELNVKTIIFPHSLPYGPLTSFQGLALLNKLEVKKRFGIPKTHVVQKLFKSASNVYGVNIILPSIVEVSGHSIYHSTLLYSSDSEGEYPIAQRKIFLSPLEEKIGFSPGKRLSVFKLNTCSCGVLHENEILTPELMRGFSILGASTIIFSTSTFPSPFEKIVEVAKALSYVFDQKVIVPGGFVINSEENVIHATPSVIISKGELVWMHDEATPSLIILKEEPHKAYNDGKNSYRHRLFSFLRDLLKLEWEYGREGAPSKSEFTERFD